LTGFRPVLGEIVTGGDVRGINRDRAAEALHDREVERTKAGSGAIDLTSSVFRWAGWGARAMFLVNLFKMTDITATFGSLAHRKPESAATEIDVLCLTDIRLQVKSESDGGERVSFRHDEPAAARSAPVANNEHEGQLYSLKSRRMPGSKPVRESALSRALFSLRELHIESEWIRIGSARVAEEALRHALGDRGSGYGRKQSLTRMPFNLESRRHEQESRGFAGL
jgi:hypothetical protein